MKILIEFLITFVVIFILFYFLIVVNGKKKEEGIYTLKLSFLEPIFKLNMKKVKVNELLWIYTIVGTFDFSLLVTGIIYLKPLWLMLVGGLISSLLVFYLSYLLLKMIFKKKGWVKDE